MTTPPPIPDLEAIRGRAEKATPGPWETRGPTAVYGRLQRDQNSTGDLVARCVQAHDATFIAHAREDIPALLSRCEELEGALGDAESLLFAVAECVDLHPKIREQIAAFQERARSTLQRGGG